MAGRSSEFASAISAAEKAWYGTPMLARVRQAKGEQLREIVRDGSPQEWAAYLSDVAGPSFVSYAVTHGLDAPKAERLGRLVLEMAWAETPGGEVAKDPAAGPRRLEIFSRILLHWIDCGAALPGGDLAKAGALLAQPEPRLAILAPFASALGVCIVMLKAMVSGCPVGVPA